MFASFFVGIGAKIIMAVLAGTLIVGGYFYWQHVVTSRALIAAQRDALIELAKRQQQTVEQKNRTDAIMRALPDDRVRLCAVQGPQSPCCTTDKECRQ